MFDFRKVNQINTPMLQLLMTLQQNSIWHLIILTIQSVFCTVCIQLQNSFLKFVFASIWRMAYVT